MRLTKAFRTAVFAGACGIAILVIIAAMMMRPDDIAGPCVVVHRTSRLPEIPEASGLAVSRRHHGILWSHNDSGHGAELFALDTAGRVRGRVRVPIVTRDWEDLSVARCPAGDCLYIADIGDNKLARRRIEIYRLPEPAVEKTETAPPEVFSAAYADGPHNAEALFVVGEDVFVITRDRERALYRSRLPAASGRELTFERIGQFEVGPVTDAEASPDGTWIVVRTSKVVVIYRTSDVVRGGTVRGGLHIPIEGLKEPQGEGVALGPNGMLYLVSEGRPWNRAGRFIALRCSVP